MTGLGFILHDNGWSCSNEVDFETEYDRIIVDGEKKSKHTYKLKFNSIFDGIGVLALNSPVYCIFKGKEQQAFTGMISQIKDGKVHITVKTKSDKLTEIKNKIQSWHKQLTS
ncbi:hypothetical protein [Mucilaginibacter sp.]|jgi:hypothetical protein|uniref:hypothetical protein n=1 Tax=Mucilaginibacter sp. TaxID=1882438 RepID=UPI0035670203